MSDYIEYIRDKFVVSCLNDENFYLINREDKKVLPIKSLNSEYISLGMQMMPCYESVFVVVRDTRGI